MQERYDFDEVTVLAPFAVGQPGNRTFFVAIGRKREWVRLWLEKGDLEAIATAVQRLLITVSKEDETATAKAGDPPAQDDMESRLPAAELDLREIGLGYDDRGPELDVTAQATGPQSSRQVVIHSRPSLSQLRVLKDEAFRVCAAGRPRCVLCGGPMDPGGHVCPRSN